MEIKELMLDSKALEKLGLAGTPLYIIEYDMPWKRIIKPNYSESRKLALEKRNKLAIAFTNKLFFALKFKIRATKHLNSCWLIDESRLDSAVELLEELKGEMKIKGFTDVDERLRVIPILTTIEGFAHYEDKKAEFLLEFAMEHIKYMDKGLKQKRMAQSSLWRCKEAFSIIGALKEELKGNKRYNEIIDTNSMLGEKIANMESIIEQDKQQKKKLKK